MDPGLDFSTDAELTGEAASVLVLLFGSWEDDTDEDDGVWGTGKVAVLGWE